jgi:hypothetical protein
MLPPSVQLDGFDVSFQAAPPQEWLPENVKLRYYNLKKDVPEDLVGQYDVVHLRHLSLVLSDDEIALAVRNVSKLLSTSRLLSAPF